MSELWTFANEHKMQWMVPVLLTLLLLAVLMVFAPGPPEPWEMSYELVQ